MQGITRFLWFDTEAVMAVTAVTAVMLSSGQLETATLQAAHDNA